MIRPGLRSTVVFLTLSATLVGAAAQQSSAPAGPQPPATGAASAQPAVPPPAPPQDPDAPPPQPTFRTDINFVRVDAIVTDKQGRPVADLKPEDFEVQEDGKPQIDRDLQADSRRWSPAAG